MRKWTLVLSVGTDSHRIFEDEHGALAIADQSGATPDTTDDGVLWLDCAEPDHLLVHDDTGAQWTVLACDAVHDWVAERLPGAGYVEQALVDHGQGIEETR